MAADRDADNDYDMCSDSGVKKVTVEHTSNPIILCY